MWMFMYWYRLGKYFGYPECCLKDFIVKVDDRLKTGAPPSVFTGTGYVPCQHCLETKTTTDIIDGINENREHSHPFPLTDQDEVDEMIMIIEREVLPKHMRRSMEVLKAQRIG